jgi:hypothetical protein
MSSTDGSPFRVEAVGKLAVEEDPQPGKIMRKPRHATAALLSGIVLATSAWAAPPERPTLNHTADPRPNILPDWIYNHHVPYRLRYNRPTYYGGKIAYHIAPTSQEAMAWEENLERGYYDGHHCPPLVKGFFYPKPWEAMNTGPRANYASQVARPLAPPAVPGAMPGPGETVIPAPLDAGAEKGEPIEGARSNRPNATAPEPEITQPDALRK